MGLFSSHRRGRSKGPWGQIRDLQAERRGAWDTYANTEGDQRKSLTEQSQASGTYANTPEFMSGLESELQGRLPGARDVNAARFNAISRQLRGLGDWGSDDIDPQTGRGLGR